MNILVVGGGGREHALVDALAKSPKTKMLYCAPGNAGIARMATCVDIQADDLAGLLAFAQQEKIDLTVVGPEVPLTMGIVDLFEANQLRIFGPNQKAAEIEGSKSFSKNLMQKYGIPTAKFAVFSEIDEAKAFVDEIGIPCVVKADGLAAGKGVIICQTKDEANQAIIQMLQDHAFGKSGQTILIEEFLQGEEVSLLAFADGKTVVPMVSAQDHKRIFDGDQGPNTGGMGAYSPAPIFTDDLLAETVQTVLRPTLAAMEQEGRRFKGILYAGLMLTDKGIRVLEYNARFGDPETQAVLPRLQSDLVEIMLASIEERLDRCEIIWSKEPALCVVIAAGGYPEKPEKGRVITGLSQALPTGAMIYHAGTKQYGDDICTDGGRVLGVTALGETISLARACAYEVIEAISFENMQYRKDIGAKALNMVRG